MSEHLAFKHVLNEAQEARRHLADLVLALDTAFISTWQSTHAWQKELDAAREFLEGKK